MRSSDARNVQKPVGTTCNLCYYTPRNERGPAPNIKQRDDDSGRRGLREWARRPPRAGAGGVRRRGVEGRRAPTGGLKG